MEVNRVERASSGGPEARMALALAFVTAVSFAAQGPQEQPLPDKSAFLEEARERLKSDDQLQGHFTYRERQVRLDYDGSGRVQKRVARVFEIYPSVEGSPSYRRLIATNGVPEPAARLEAADRKHRERVQEWVRNRQAESPDARARRELKEKRDRDRETRIVDDIPRVYDITLVGREEIRGRPAIVLTLTPRPGVRPVVEDAAPMTKLVARAWVDEKEYEIVRVELESTDTISVGLGLLARIGKGTTLKFERQKVDDEAWLPARVEVRPKARIALVKRVDADIVSEFGDYRKYTVETAIEFAMPKPGKQ
jgi:YD repeat-containing protein